jgi:hypothetical protein
MIRASIWAALLAAVVLATRTIVYALTPWQTLIAAELAHRAGGPQLAVVLGVSLAAAALLAAAVLWVAALAVRERLALEPRELLAAPRLPLLRLAGRAVVLFATCSVGFALLESYLHWRAGLGWHGLRCLVGPVHRDAIPVVGALSLVAVAVHGAVEHLLAWVRRLVALFTARVRLLQGVRRGFGSTPSLRTARPGSPAVPRGPPALSPA